MNGYLLIGARDRRLNMPVQDINEIVSDLAPKQLSPLEEYKELLTKYKSGKGANPKYTRPSITEWQNAYGKGAFNGPDVHDQIDAGWYDWFASDKSLPNKTKKLGYIISQIRPGGKVDLEGNYPWFKNNMPLSGPLYDDFRFADRETGDVQMTTQIGSPWGGKKYQVWGRRQKGGDFNHDAPLFESDSLADLINWYNTPWEDAPAPVKQEVAQKLLGSKSKFAQKYPDRFAKLKGRNYGPGRTEEDVDWDDIASILGMEL